MFFSNRKGAESCSGEIISGHIVDRYLGIEGTDLINEPPKKERKDSEVYSVCTLYACDSEIQKDNYLVSMYIYKIEIIAARPSLIHASTK